jgi:hypothetical protein
MIQRLGSMNNVVKATTYKQIVMFTLFLKKVPIKTNILGGIMPSRENSKILISGGI